MRAPVLARHPWNDRVLEDDRRVAAEQVAPIELEADEERVLVRAIVVGEKNLVIPAVELGQRDRCAANANAARIGVDPEGGVLGGDEKLRRRRGRRVRLAAIAGAARGAQSSCRREREDMQGRNIGGAAL
jgi:hypothetical protein